MRFLVSGHGQDKDALDRARRTIAYDRLVLLSSKPESNEIQRLVEHERMANVEVTVLPAEKGNLLHNLAQAHAAFAHKPTDSLIVHVAGGPNLVTSALLLACFEQGVNAFYCHERGVSWLPVIRSARFVDRFSTTEAEILRALSPGSIVKHESLGIEAASAESLKRALYRLKQMDLVTADASTATLTARGEYYRQHLLSEGGSIVRGAVEGSDEPKKRRGRSSKPHGPPRDTQTAPSRQGRRIRSR